MDMLAAGQQAVARVESNLEAPHPDRVMGLLLSQTQFSTILSKVEAVADVEREMRHLPGER
jgi:hypothetical protein